MSEIKEALDKNKDIRKEHFDAFMARADEATKQRFNEAVKGSRHHEVFDIVREFFVREIVRRKLNEVIKKKVGGGYVLMSPKRKGKKAHAMGTYSSRLAAQKAQFARFPPKDPVAKAKARERIAAAVANKKKKDKKKNESMDVLALRVAVRKMMVESLFREEKAGSEWDEYVSKLPKQIFSTDRKLSNLQKGIERKVESILEDALAHIAKAVGKKVKVKSHGIKKNDAGGKTYLAFGCNVDGVSVDPIYIYVQGGVPKLEVSDNARAALTKIDPDQSKMFRADLVQVQERVLDHMDDLARAIESRDKYLMKIEAEVDKYLADLSGLQLTMLKRLLTMKYRKAY